MENISNRSVRFLEDSLSVPGTSVLRPSVFKLKKDAAKSLSLSLTLSPDEILFLQQNSQTEPNCTFVNDTLIYHSSSKIFNTVSLNESLKGTVIRTKEPWKNAFDLLHIEFSEILQSYSGSQDVLETISDLGRCCADALKVVEGLKAQVSVRHIDPEELWLRNEGNTWRLIHILYQDRLATAYLREEEQDIDQYFGLSEKRCVENLFKRDNLVRESQLVIDWLENNAKLATPVDFYYTDITVGWENTLHQLQSKDTIAFVSKREIVKSLHPDAPTYENKPLHELDEQDEKALCKRIFHLIRCGNLDGAQKHCIDCGHAWKAALFEGWRLFHDPSREVDESGNYNETICSTEQEVEGNYNRDLWKRMSFKYSDSNKLNRYIRSSIATYCGYLKQILPVCENWEDYLWAYLKVMIDIRVESEVRDCVNKTYTSLPDFYWDQRMSLNEVFSHLETSDCKYVKEQAKKPDYIIIKYLILDDIPQMFVALEEYLNEDASIHLLRFLTHLVLFLDQIGQAPQRNVAENVLEMYIKRLSTMDDIGLVAFYVSKLGTQKQVDLYSRFLEGITADEQRRTALKYAEDCGLNVALITKTVVENIIERPFDFTDMSLQERLTPGDEYKISSIDWLLFYESDRLEAIIQSNALIHKFLALKKLDAAQLVFNKIPPDSAEMIMSTLSDTQISLKEHLCYRAYLDAQEAFSLWFKHYKMKPIEPESIPVNAHLTEKVAHQHKTSQYKAEIERWKMTMSHLAKSAKTLLYNVLLFPDGGWLGGVNNAERLRSTCIPECTLLLYNVLFESGLLSECIRLADILASEKYQLYKVYSKESLREILRKLSEASVALLNSKMDPWGNDGFN
nr:nuclear pore complex protein Nup107 [Onthophagus taurus]